MRFYRFSLEKKINRLEGEIIKIDKDIDTLTQKKKRHKDEISQLKEKLKNKSK